MNDLEEAVDALTEVRLAQIDTDNGPLWVSGDPRLKQLEDAITSTMGNGGGSAGLKSERTILDPDALHRGVTITAQIGDWCRMDGLKPTRHAITDLRTWRDHRAEDADNTWRIGQLHKWAREIDGMFDRPRPIDITVPCPVCGERTFTNDQGDVCAWPLKARTDPITVECRSCETTWDGPDAAEELAEEIGATRPPEGDTAA